MARRQLPVVIALATAFWLGLLTSISPCPLATNVAAVGYLTGRSQSDRQSLVRGILYALGRAIAYALLGGLLTWGVLSAMGASSFLQHGVNRALGPLLILAGMVLLDLLPLPSFGVDLPGLSSRLADRGGSLGACAMGMVFALSFCPVSAAIFFGSLLPLATTHHLTWIAPAVFGIGTAVPVLVATVLLSFGARRVGALTRSAERFDAWLRRSTGILFVAAGLYVSWTYVLEPLL